MATGFSAESCVLTFGTLSGCIISRELQDIATGAFAGAAISVLSSSDFSYFKQFVIFIISFITGAFTCTLAGDILTYLTPDIVVISPRVGALLSAAVSVRFLIVVARDPFGLLENFVKLIRGKS
ncbi:putative holin [Yokenella regensburgei]|uniref:putative holin n=1 Tax=Yokenella regensburgei TaxID=158877 RepID=UPI003EDB2653